MKTSFESIAIAMNLSQRLLRIVGVVLLGAALTLAAPEVQDVTVPGVGRYHLNTSSLNWTQAHTACKMMNGYLAVPETHEEAAAIGDLMKTYSVQSVHIGFHDMYEERSYVTVLDQPMEKMAFQVGAPNSTGSLSENCGRFNGTGYVMGACSTAIASMCQLRMWDEYTQVGSYGYYKVHTAGRPWSQAWATCREENADLLVLRSSEEYDAVYTIFRNQLHQKSFHYGAHHLFANQLFYTIFDEPLNWSGFSQWMNGLPNGLFNGNVPYLAIVFNEVTLRGLTATTTTETLPFICKHDLHRA